MYSGKLVALNKHFLAVLPSGAHLSAETTVAKRIRCLAQGHNILVHPGFEPLIAVSRNLHLFNLINFLLVF